MHDAMIQDLSHHYTLAELSRQFGIAQTSMKLCFKAVYGSSIYQYMKTYRMQTARVLLQDICLLGAFFRLVRIRSLIKVQHNVYEFLGFTGQTSLPLLTNQRAW